MADVAVTMDSDVTPALPNWVWIQSWQIDSYGPGGLGGGGFAAGDADEGWTYGKDFKTIMVGLGH